MRTTPKLSRRTALAVLAATAAGQSKAQTPGPGAFPSRLIKIVPFGAAGGLIDSIARVYAGKLHARWGQAVIVEAKPGASGILAADADAVAKAPPDGHTVMFTLPLTHINNAILQPKLPYDPLKDFEPLSQLATGGPMLETRADAPYANLREFVAYARAHSGLSYGNWGKGSGAHLFGEQRQRREGLKFVHVPYEADYPRLAELIKTAGVTAE